MQARKLSVSTSWFIALAGLLCLSCSIAFAQTITATILGAIHDPSGAAIPGATVVVTNTATDIARTVTADKAGYYEVPLLKPGGYRVQVSYHGFKTQERTGIVVQVDERARVDFTLEVGATTQTVQVQGNAPLVSTDSSAIGQVIGTREVLQMPLNGRYFVQLATLAPGTVEANNAGTNCNFLGQGGCISVNGSRPQSQMFMVDGTNNDDPLWGGFDLSPSIDDLQEFKVQNTLYSAEFGGSSGSQINVVTKSGGNQFHGDAYEFFRNSALNARNFFTPSVPPLNQNQFGATFGGPIRKDHTFFFLSYEGFRQRSGASTVELTPTIAQRNGVFSTTILDPYTGLPFPNDTVPSTMISPIATKILSMFYPLPNLVPATPTANYIASFSAPYAYDEMSARVDDRISDKSNFFVRYAYQNNRSSEPGPYTIGIPAVDQFGTNESLGINNVSANYVYNINPENLNVFRFTANVTRNLNAEYQNFGTNLITPAGITGILPLPSSQAKYVNFPAVTVIAYPQIGEGEFGPITDTPNLFEWTDNFTSIRGKHTLNIGAELGYIQATNETGLAINGWFYFAGLWTGNALADLLTGLPAFSQKAVGMSAENLLRHTYAPYFQDDWQVNKRLTLNLGLRYEYFSPYAEAHGELTDLVPDAAGKLSVEMGGQNGVPKSIIQPDYHGWGPRFGFAWRPFGGTKTVLRGGYGVFYDREISNSNFLMHLNPPYTNNLNIFNSTGNFLTTLQDPFPPASPGAATSAYAYSNSVNGADGYVQNWSMNLERQIGNDTVAKVAYIGSAGTHLMGQYYLNQALPSPLGYCACRAPDPAYSTIDDEAPFGRSWYNGLNASLQRRFGNGLSFLAAYTWGRALDTTSSIQTGVPQNVYAGWNANKGLSEFNIGQNFELSYTYPLPFGSGQRFLSGIGGKAVNRLLSGWETTGILGAHTGVPFTVGVSGDNAGSGVNANHANRICNGTLPGDQQTIQGWFNTACFVMPALGTFGNSGRDILNKPGAFDWDIGILKNTAIAESKTLEFRFEAFNVTNAVNWSGPNTSVNSGPLFGRISSAGGGRVLQVALKLYF